jgi:hypothetical protein
METIPPSEGVCAPWAWRNRQDTTCRGVRKEAPPKFSSVFWLDGRTEDSLKQSIAIVQAGFLEGQIAESSKAYSATSAGDVNAVVRDVMSWLSRPDNTDWLIIFDNVDRESQGDNADPDAYDVTGYLPSADHGSVLITTRLANLEQLGVSWRLGKA